ncbi:MAG: MBL fold metallo-hydrolase [Oscillospiraceae bacterium]|nr:MBL fold metallo-hydrolase [Oscillospiraceae bacterium]
MKILHRPVGQLGTNCFLLIDEETNCAALIDPGDNATQLAELVRANAVTLTHILLTHGHYDHTTAAPALAKEFPEAKVYIHEADADGTGIQERPMRGAVENLHFYADGDTVKVGNLTLNVLHTPGHTPGSVVLTVEDVMFSGDTLFAGSCGRVDFPGGDAQAMLRSLKRLYQLEGDYTVLPGHMEGSTLRRERASNMYMKQAIR